MMTCRELAARIEELQPDAAPRDVARLCLLLANAVEDIDSLVDDRQLTSAWQETGIRLQAACDQHAAMAEELETLAQMEPMTFRLEEIWVLIRAIKVQGQILQLYVGKSEEAESESPPER